MPDEQADIRLHDLINDLAEDIVKGADGQSFSSTASVDKTELNARMRRYGSLCEKLVGVAAVAGYWGKRRHFSLWTNVLQRLMTVKRHEWYRDFWLRLALYPATLLLYSLGVGAVARKRLHMLSELLAVPTEDDRASCVAHLLAPYWLGKKDVMQLLDGMSVRNFPLNDWVYENLRGSLRSVLAHDSAYQMAFDELEVLLALSFTTRADSWTIERGVSFHPPGCYLNRTRRTDDLHPVLEGMKQSIAEHGSTSVYVESRIFGDTADECSDRLQAFSKYVLHMQNRMLFW